MEKKWQKTIEQYYAKAPYYDSVAPMIQSVLDLDCDDISTLAVFSIKAICNYLQISTQMVDSSIIYRNQHLKGQNRVLDICKQEGCTTYINPIGGSEIYTKEAFQSHAIDLYFLQANNVVYQQFSYPFTPFLSIIDVLMHNHINNLQQFLHGYQLV